MSTATEVKHTAGPWSLMDGMPTNVLGWKGYRVARCDFDGDFDSEEAKANARLIAAAPDLLSDLQDQVAWLRHYLTQLVHVSVPDERGHMGNGFAAAQIPDWAIKQKLDDLEADIRKAKGETL